MRSKYYEANGNNNSEISIINLRGAAPSSRLINRCGKCLKMWRQQKVGAAITVGVVGAGRRDNSSSRCKGSGAPGQDSRSNRRSCRSRQSKNAKDLKGEEYGGSSGRSRRCRRYKSPRREM